MRRCLCRRRGGDDDAAGVRRPGPQTFKRPPQSDEPSVEHRSPLLRRSPVLLLPTCARSDPATPRTWLRCGWPAMTDSTGWCWSSRTGCPGYTVGYRPLPAHADGSGARSRYPKRARWWRSRSTPATGGGWSGDARTYFGPSTVTANTAEVTEVKSAGDFEAVLTWVVGLRDQGSVPSPRTRRTTSLGHRLSALSATSRDAVLHVLAVDLRDLHVSGVGPFGPGELTPKRLLHLRRNS